MAMHSEKRTKSFYFLMIFFILFVLFLYGPILAITVLSFQGPTGGLTQRVGDFKSSFSRSFILAIIVMILTVLISLAAGLAFRRRFIGSTVVFYLKHTKKQHAI